MKTYIEVDDTDRELLLSLLAGRPSVIRLRTRLQRPLRAFEVAYKTTPAVVMFVEGDIISRLEEREDGLDERELVQVAQAAQESWYWTKGFAGDAMMSTAWELVDMAIEDALQARPYPLCVDCDGGNEHTTCAGPEPDDL